MRKVRWIEDAETFANWEYVPARRERVKNKAVVLMFGQVGSGLLLGAAAGVLAASVVIGVVVLVKWVVS